MTPFRSTPAFVMIVLLSMSVMAQDSNRFTPAWTDPTCKPCEDFYQFVNGNWLKQNPVPAEFPTWGTFTILQQSNRSTLRDILETAASGRGQSDASRLVGAFYQSCMDEPRIESQGLSPIADELAAIAGLKDVAGLSRELARLHNSGVAAMFQFGSAADRKNSAQMIASAGQGGLSLPNKDYYTKTDDKSKQTRDALVKHVGRIFELSGEGPEIASRHAATVLEVQMRLADGSMDPIEVRDITATTNKRSMSQFQQLMPAFSWKDYFEGRGVPAFSDLNVLQPKFFEQLNGLLRTIPLADWQTYLRWQVLTNAAPRLASKFRQENFDFFNLTLNGTPQQQPRWQQCVIATDASLGDALGQAFVERKFSAQSKARMDALVDNLTLAFRERIQTRSWMSSATRQQALKKLEAIKRKIGYPDQWKQYASLRIVPDQFFRNSLQAATLDIQRNLAKIGQPTDRSEWGMTAPTVNAYYRSGNNEIAFPAGILQPPFFDPEADDALNYGAIGAVIGHEMTHAFDDRGSQFDAAGNLESWWTADDRNKFQTRAECVSEQFSGFKTSEGTNLNGKLVLSESIADLGGVTIAYHAFLKSMEGKPRPANIDGFTPEQRFFIGYAVVWARNQRPEAERRQALTDEHALARYRTNGPLSNLEEFAAAFACKAQDAMVRPANRQCQIW